MGDRTKLKHVCPDCKTNKWIIDYKEGCAADLTRHSICLFCQQAREIEKLKKDNLELKNMVKEIYSQIGEMNKEVVDNGRSIHELRSQLVAAKPTLVERTPNKNETENVNKDREEMFRKATGRRVTTKKTDKPRSKETLTSNRFSLLADEEEETVLIGDSMVKSQGEHFGSKNKKKRKVRSYPGANARKILEELGKIEIENKKTTIIVQASGNDLFLRNGNAGSTEPLVKQLENTIETAKKKTNNAIVLGILPRLDVSHFALSKALGINGRLKSICQKKGVRYIDLWDTFYGNRKMYRRDGIHFSEEGMRLYGSQLNLSLYNHLSTAKTSQSKAIEKSSNSNEMDTIVNNRQMAVDQGNE